MIETTPPDSPVQTPPADEEDREKTLDVTEKGSKGYTISANEYGTCPICSQKWQNPAVLPSGWVVCWRCGWDALEGESGEEDEEDRGSDDGSKVLDHGVQETREGGRGRKGRKGMCPITGVSVGPGQLRRVLV